ncbi:MAG TPA: phosphate ABC transporter substrate-binding protein PstS, partial [Thermoplasmata archaeon]|nr:phosphate ABC transporter substrate-binding protein PstS [Thermoplasmata archaeon]
QSMTFARVQNLAGTFVLPSISSTAAAAATVAASLPQGEGDWKDVSIVNAPGTDSYPIASLTYLLVYRELNTYGGAMTQAKAKALVDFIWWAVSAQCPNAPETCDGQSYSTALQYVPLPTGVVNIDVRTIGLITYNGQVVHGG